MKKALVLSYNKTAVSLLKETHFHRDFFFLFLWLDDLNLHCLGYVKYLFFKKRRATSCLIFLDVLTDV